MRVASTLPTPTAQARPTPSSRRRDPSANPYLALGGLLAAGLDGVTRELEPGEPVLVDPGDYSEARARSGAASSAYPTTLRAALDRAGERRGAHGGARPAAGARVPRCEALGERSFGAEDAAFELEASLLEVLSLDLDLSVSHPRSALLTRSCVREPPERGGLPALLHRERRPGDARAPRPRHHLLPVGHPGAGGVPGLRADRRGRARRARAHVRQMRWRSGCLREANMRHAARRPRLSTGDT